MIEKRYYFFYFSRSSLEYYASDSESIVSSSSSDDEDDFYLGVDEHSEPHKTLREMISMRKMTFFFCFYWIFCKNNNNE